MVAVDDRGRVDQQLSVMTSTIRMMTMEKKMMMEQNSAAEAGRD